MSVSYEGPVMNIHKHFKAQVPFLTTQKVFRNRGNNRDIQILLEN